MKNIFTLALTALSFGAFAQTNDPASCYNESSAVYYCTEVGLNDGYEDGYAAGVADCEPDTVVVTDTVIVDISAETLAYYLNVIENLENATEELQNTVATLNDSINNLEQGLYVTSFTLNITQAALDNCFDDSNACNGALDAANATIAAQDATILTLTEQLDACTTGYDECLDTNAGLIENYNALADDYAECVEYSLLLDSALNATAAELEECEVWSEVWQTATESYAEDVAVLTEQLAGCEETVLGVDADYDTCTAENEELNALVDALIYQLEVLVDGHSDLLDILNGQLDDCNESNAALAAELAIAEDEVLYWMDAYEDHVNACNGAIEQLSDEYNELAEELEACENGTADGTLYTYGDLMNAFQDGVESVECPVCVDFDDVYDLGYENGLTDCENSGADGTVTGILEMDGYTVTPVVGYYNELGQVIDPTNYRGLVIRRHADGTFSKYIKQ